MFAFSKFRKEKLEQYLKDKIITLAGALEEKEEAVKDAQRDCNGIKFQLEAKTKELEDLQNITSDDIIASLYNEHEREQKALDKRVKEKEKEDKLINAVII